jgi:G3E family GTPase
VTTANVNDAIPVHVLTGFLGAGKTTFLNDALHDPALADAAVVVNEFGMIAMDHVLIERSDDLLIALPGGCLCCAVRGDLATTIALLLSRRDKGTCPPFSSVVIETSGLAEPNPIANLLITDPLLAERTRLGAVVVIVDAVNGSYTLDTYGEAKKQVALATSVLITKTDLADPKAAREWVRRLNPAARIQCSKPDTKPDITGLLNVESNQGGHVLPSDSAHTAGIERFVIEYDEPMDAAVLPLLVEHLAIHLGADLLRLKGFVHIDGVSAGPALLQGAQHVFFPLDVLPAWPEGMRHQTTLTFITLGNYREFVELLLEAVIYDVRQQRKAIRLTEECHV